jgi:hypothetical protein
MVMRLGSIWSWMQKSAHMFQVVSSKGNAIGHSLMHKLEFMVDSRLLGTRASVQDGFDGNAVRLWFRNASLGKEKEREQQFC